MRSPWQGTYVVDPYCRPEPWFEDLDLSALDEFVGDDN